MASDVYRASVRGARQASRDLSRARRGIQQDIDTEIRTLGARAAQAVEIEAPLGETGDLRDSVEAKFSFSKGRSRFTIVAGAEHGGFDYLNVTRFGHRKKTIRAKHAKALRIDTEIGEFVKDDAESGVVVKEVPGYRPAFDWVNLGIARADDEFDESMRRLGRRIDRRLLR